MEYGIEFSERAKKELADQIAYYELQSPGLGIRFSEAVISLVTVLKRMPFSQVRYDDIRCIPLKTFPFMIHYRIDEDDSTILIYGIVHTSLDPEKHWKVNEDVVAYIAKLECMEFVPITDSI